MQPPSFPSLLPTPSSCQHAHRGGGAASGQEPSELLVESVKEQNKKGVALFSYTSASCCFGDFAAWDEKLEKLTASPPIPPCMLGKEKAHMLRKATVPGQP